jgi:CRP-like cAMP-binding protein
MSLKDDITILGDVPIFGDLSDEQLRLVAFGAERRRIPAGQVLFRQGSAADCAYAVASGAFDLERTDHQGRTIKLGAAKPGTLLGELALISLTERKTTAVAAESSEVIRITRPLFNRMIEEYPELGTIMRRRIEANLQRLIDGLSALSPRLGG